MGNPIKVKYKFGQIEFEAEGDSCDVEKQRDYFMNAIIPVATTIVNRIPAVEEGVIEKPTVKYIDVVKDNATSSTNRTNLITFLKDYKDLSDRDFTLLAAFYHEQQSASSYVFTSEDVRNFFKEARRPEAKNISDILLKLAKAGLIMETDNPENKIPKPYLITQDGLSFIEQYTPKERAEKNTKRSPVTKKKIDSIYKDLNTDDLQLRKYPIIKDLKSSKEQIILAMYIITEEEKGKWFLTTDVEYILTNIFNIHITLKQVSNLFDRNRDLFAKQPSERNKKANEYRLLSGAVDFAKKIIAENLNTSD